MNFTHITLYSMILVISFCATFLIEKKVIPILSKKAHQPIYTDGPSWHITKSGTPTMGGVAFLPTIILCLVLSIVFVCFDIGQECDTLSLFISCLFILGNSVIGIFDDLTKLRHKKNEGFTPIQKLILQTLLSVIFMMAQVRFCNLSSLLSIGNFTLDLGLFYYPLSIFVILGIINCANLTDGIDGLASCVALTVGFVLFSLTVGYNVSSSVISLMMIGISSAFLCFNIHPAKIFMGDTGSLLFGAMAVCSAFGLKNFFLIIPLCAVYVIEGVSVVLQVLFFKATGKRLFKMSPLHHHLERSGMNENTICISAIAITLIICSILIIR